MAFVSIQKAMDMGNGFVKLHGWVHRERGSSNIKFIILRDSTNIIQCVIKKDVVGEDVFEVVDKLQVETSIELEGTIKEDSRAPSGYEVTVKSISIVGDSDTFPITKDQSVEFLADNRHLWLRSRKMTAMLKIRHTVFGAIHEYFRNNNFYEFHAPLFTPNQCEGGSTLFKVDYFGEEVYLAQTWQLYAEAAVFALEKIYTIAPSFRSEKSKTSRHLTEYWHAEMEIAWCRMTDLAKHAELLLKFIVKRVLDNNKGELKILERDTSFLYPTVEKDFVIMTYDGALKILKEKCSMDIEWGKDLRTIEEEKLTKLYDTPIIVTDYPKEVKAFYMKESHNNKDTVQGFDVLAPEGYGEIIGGSQRVESSDELKQRLTAQGEKPEEYDWYLDLRRYGSVPHGGFGLGVERVVTWICGLDNIKDAIPFPRTMVRKYP